LGAAVVGVEWRSVAYTASIAVVSLVYYAYFEGGASGQTPGKRVARIRVMDLDTGAPLGFGRAAVRHMARGISGALLTIGYLWMLWDAERQTWHDKLSDSVVVPVEDYPVE
jgi:uncharacterized RDD family membrane protein YckC